MMEWQPIETAPKDGTTILLWSDGYIELGGWIPAVRPWNDGAWWVSGGQVTLPNPTHWMPLPNPPKETA